MFKNSLVLGVISGLLSGLACVIYAKVYFTANEIDFSSIASNLVLFSSCIFGCVLASIGFYFSTKLMKKKGEILFNFLFTILSFASILGPIAATLPLDFEFPELFPGYAIPMHFFPALAWFTVKPIFIK